MEAEQLQERSEVLVVSEAAKYLRVSEVTVRSLLRRGELPGWKIGKEWRISRTALEELLRRQQASQ